MLETVDLVRELYAKHEYKLFDSDSYDLNFFGIRRNLSSNKFDDLIGCYYRAIKGSTPTVELWAGTTDPGRTFLLAPMNKNGTAAVAAAQHRACWSLGVYKERPALRQTGIIKVYRDNDRDSILEIDPTKIFDGSGIHLHYMGDGIDRDVNSWSAGCQGVATRAHFERIIWLAREQLRRHPTWKTFTYTLFDTDKDTEALTLFT
jgi:hypothetical protein